MAFVKATIEIRPASVGTGIKATLRRSKKAAATLSLFVSASRAAALNIGDGDGIEVLIGDGEHHGLIRLRKNNSAGVTKAEKRATGKADFFVLKLGHQAAFVDRSEAAAWCQWELVEEGWVEIVLPKWADDTAPGRTIHGVAQAKPPAPERPRQSVTAGLMGDPPPGRRQMLEKVGKIAGGGAVMRRRSLHSFPASCAVGLMLGAVAIGTGFVAKAWPHDALPTTAKPQGWSYPFACCANYDCESVPDSAIVEGARGYEIRQTGELIPTRDKRIKDSPDGQFHWCAHRAGLDAGKTICLFVPPRAM